jgi:cytochrome P450
VDELLRIGPPSHNIFRVTTVDTELGGVQLPRGSMVMLVLGSANRDPARFAEPDRFDAARDSHAGLAFDRGVHYCLGAMLARLEARCLVEELALASSASKGYPERSSGTSRSTFAGR